MKLKLKQLLISDAAGTPLVLAALRRVRQMPLPAYRSFEVLKLCRQVEPLLADGIEARNAAVRLHGKDGFIEPNTPGMEAFLKEMTDLGERDVELTLRAKIKMSAEVKISAEDWDVLDAFIELEEVGS